MRVSSESAYRQVLAGLRLNFSSLVRAQEQVSSGWRILRPSDDPTGTAKVLSLQRSLADSQRIRDSIDGGRIYVDAASAALEQASGLIAEARALVIQGMNGTISDTDRAAIGEQIVLVRTQLLELANQQTADRFLFGGTAGQVAPWEVQTIGGVEQVVYLGDSREQEIRIGSGVTIGINVPGDQIFAGFQPTGLSFAGLTGLSAGSMASQGKGEAWIEVRQDTLDVGAIGSVGVALGSSPSTLIGSHGLVIDAAAGTIRLGDGPAVPLPDPASQGATNLTLQTGMGATLSLDLSGYSGGDYLGTVTGQGSISLNGGSYEPMDLTAENLRLEDPSRGQVLHVDPSGVGRAGRELVQFAGAIDLFDVLAGLADDFRNPEGLQQGDLLGRANQRLEELDRHHGNVLSNLGVLGARSARMGATAQRFEGVGLQLSSLISERRDADYTEVVLEMSRAENTLQLAQATGVRLIQRSLLDFLR
jgi:flagellar hook-associated protein 3 FlgL